MEPLYRANFLLRAYNLQPSPSPSSRYFQSPTLAAADKQHSLMLRYPHHAELRLVLLSYALIKAASVSSQEKVSSGHKKLFFVSLYSEHFY